MKVTHSIYNFNKSLERIDDILNSSDYNYDEHKRIPSERRLNFKELVWIGKVVGESAKLSGYGCKEWNDKRIMISEKVYKKLTKYQQKFLEQNKNRDCYHGTFWWKDYE